MADGRALTCISLPLRCANTLPKAETDCYASTVNERRSIRVVEIMNDFRTLQHHISTHITRAQSSPPDEQSYYLDGYVVLRQCAAEAQAILATHYNPGVIGMESGHVPETEKQKATLQRYANHQSLSNHC
jgi:hypothetical protein